MEKKLREFPSLLQAAYDGTPEEFDAQLKKWLVRGWRFIFRGAEGGRD